MLASTNITIAIAFLAGLASFLSPCVLPLVPGYVSLISGVSVDQLKRGRGAGRASRRAVVINSLAFNAGLSMIFVSLGAAAGLIGTPVISSPWLRVLGGLVIVGFGMQMVGLLKISALYRDTRFFSADEPRGVLGSLMLGMGFAAGWTPCIGPILGGIIGLAATSGGWKSGLILSLLYAAGLAVPFLLTGLGINQFLSFYARFRRHLHKVEVVSGIALILIGVAIATGYATRLSSSSLAALLPNLESRIKVTGNAPAVSSPADSALKLAPQVQLHDPDGKPFNLGDLHGRVVLLNFWATWCIPCRAETPELTALQHDFEPSGLSVVGISWDDSAAGVRRFQRDIPQDYTVLLGGEGVQAEFGGIRSLPTSYIIDRQGRIRQTIVGARDRAVFEAALRPVLDEASSTN